MSEQTFSKQDEAELVNLYHTARSALSDQPDQGRHARLLYAAAQFSKSHGVSKVAAYKAVCRLTSP